MYDIHEFAYPIAKPVKRFTAFLLDLILVPLTLGIWAIIAWDKGQTPGKQVMKLRVYSTASGKPAKWTHMGIREFLVPLAYFTMFFLTQTISLLATITDFTPSTTRHNFVWFHGHHFGLGVLITIAIWLIDGLWANLGFGKRSLTDLFVKTIVLDETSIKSGQAQR